MRERRVLWRDARVGRLGERFRRSGEREREISLGFRERSRAERRNGEDHKENDAIMALRSAKINLNCPMKGIFGINKIEGNDENWRRSVLICFL